MEDHLRSLGAVERTEGYGRAWTLSTRLGDLEVSVWTRAVMMIFVDVARAKVALGRDYDFNSHSGKWNLHWYTDDPVDYRMAQLASRLARVMEPTA